MTSPAEPLNARRLVDMLAQSLAARIAQGQYGTGERLPTESEIMKQWDVSRTVVRECISQLQAAGLVQTRHGTGTFVVPAEGNRGLLGVVSATLSDVLQMLEFRLSIETEAAAMAAARITSEEVDRLRTIVKISASAPLADRADADFRFHHALARVSGNRYIAQVLDGLRVQAIPRNRIDPGAPSEKDRSGYEAKIAQEHELIVDALAIGDSSAARAAMHLHLAHSRDRLIAALERIPAESHRRKRRGERP